MIAKPLNDVTYPTRLWRIYLPRLRWNYIRNWREWKQ